jgi:hypothetical protein
MAAVLGLGTGYFATTGGPFERVRTREERQAAAPAFAHELAEMEAAAAFLEGEERRAAAVPASADL